MGVASFFALCPNEPSRLAWPTVASFFVLCPNDPKTARWPTAGHAKTSGNPSAPVVTLPWGKRRHGRRARSASEALEAKRDAPRSPQRDVKISQARVGLLHPGPPCHSVQLAHLRGPEG